MKQWKARFTLNGRLMETIITARTYSDAKALIEGQYSSGKLQILSISEVR